MRKTIDSASSTVRAGPFMTATPLAARLFDMRTVRGVSTPMARSSAERAKTSCGLPSSATSPSSSTITRSQYSARSATICSTTTTVTPVARCAFRRTSKTDRELAGSSAAVGSSRTRTRGASARIAAMATFCFCPPERVAISRWRRSAMPTASSAADSLPSIRSRGTPKFSRPNSNSSSTTDATICASMS